MRYGETIPADVTNACAASKIADHNSDSGNATGIPEWGPHSTWLTHDNSEQYYNDNSQ
jgi:hypothetical protein